MYTNLPKIDECKYLILKIIEQAIRDYLALQYSTAPIEQLYYQTAYDFIYDDDYSIQYGEGEKTLSDLLDILDMDLKWLREKVTRLKEKKIQEFKRKGILRGKYRK